MRILKIRFKNLNSLVGEWEIDLTHPAFASDGIFAITGPTGAGKTTILDAVCLALYGRTPRLSKVTRSGNEVMSRQTGECFAEVTFETQAGRFRCHWSQHRARKKTDGEFQAPKHEIADADSGEIFETRIKGVADQIEAATGMDFDRFTRSMLLAQGGFAVFLQAIPDDRAPILEQITGTEIYSRISIRVHERCSEERKRLDALQAELAGMQLLAPEDEQLLAESLDGKVRQDAELTRLVAQKNLAITWTLGMARLEEELKALGQAKDELQARMEAFVPEDERLRLANQALELSADHAALTAARKEQDADRGSLREWRESLPACTDAARQAEDAMKTASGRLAANKTEQQNALPVIRKVRELDLKIAEKDPPIEAANDSIAEHLTSLDTLRSKQKNDSGELGDRRRVLAELQALLTASRADGELVERLAGLRSRFDVLKVLNGQLAGKLKEATQAGSRLQEALSAWRKQAACLEKRRRDLDGIQGALAEKHAGLLEILEGRDVAEWRKSQASLAAQKDLIVKTLDAVRVLSKSKRAQIELDSRRLTLKQEETSLSTTLAARAERQAALEKETGLLETQLTLLKRIEDLEEVRSQLQDGEPCPLCGAREHPFAEGNVPAPDETRQRLATVRAELKFVNGDISNLKVRLAQVGKDLEQVAAARKEHDEKIGEAGRVIGDNCSELTLEPGRSASDPELSGELEGLREENARRLVYAARILGTAESIEKELAELRESLEKARDALAKREREAQDAAHKKDSVEQLLERMREEAAGYREQQEKSFGALQKEIEAFGIAALSIDTLDAVFEQLTARRDKWVAGNKEKAELERRIAALEMQTRHQAEQLQQGENDLRKQQEHLAGLLRDREVLCRERRELFGDRKTDDEEVRLAGAVESAEKDLDRARQRLSSAHQELNQLKAKIDEMEKTIRSRDLRLKSMGQAFLTRLEASGFTGEDHYRSACLSEGERRQLAQKSQKLSDGMTEITSKVLEKAGLLEVERQKKITEEPLDGLENALALLVADQRERQQEIGGIRQKLKDNESLKQRHQERVQAIDAQKRECARWNLLHDLIGSADGKKYRNFVQGLTFEMMIGHANRQLQKMTDRYLLVRDDAQPLELNVIDNYQAGEVRSTKNLSGGESFIVSLALALGLSQMAGRNVQVDSLFLDEGFGTLDEEALDTALETLAGLQRDGKLIGVISHVPAIRERISARIQVTPQTGGRSRISGPGCRKLEASQQGPG
ncbi:MAG TPA: AAA family ATPase [Syntrophales bacterium]|nr:AAA family ATPase [Syntrophales bacterium]